MSDKKENHRFSGEGLKKVTGGGINGDVKTGGSEDGLDFFGNPKNGSKKDPNVIPAYANPKIFEKNQPNLDIPPVSDPNGGHTTTNW